MPETRLERTRRAYDLVIDMRPWGCRLVDVGTPDSATLNKLWERSSGWNVIEGEHFSADIANYVPKLGD